jgi:mono/diheme cytochrome c family protein
MMNLVAGRVVLCLALGVGSIPSARGAVTASGLFHGVSPLANPGGSTTRPANVRLAQGVMPAAGGLYSASQAERGKAVYEQSCGTCHGSALRGGANEFAAPALAGPFFYEKWSGRPLGELFRYAVENMPPDQTKLAESAYLDVMAYVLQVLKHPAGTADLTADSPAMKQRIEAPK